VVYHNKLGTQGERVERVRAIAKAIGQQQLGGEQLALPPSAALLAKTDLLTDMVGEFPELQGIMGRYYALHDGLPDVADAIEDHYKPRFAGDALPRNTVGVVVALADKLETLVGMFGIGNLPTGDRDPFALRRHALGVIRMLVEKDLPPLRAAGRRRPPLATRSPTPSLRWPTSSTTASPAACASRATARRKSMPCWPCARSAWARCPSAGGRARLCRAARSPALAAANKRVGNILKKAELEGPVDAHVNPACCRSRPKRTYTALQRFVPEANAQFDAGDYTASLQTLAVLRAPVDAFFDDVMVNAEQLDLRLNRLGLLKSLHDAMNRVADLSRLEQIGERYGLDLHGVAACGDNLEHLLAAQAAGCEPHLVLTGKAAVLAGHPLPDGFPRGTQVHADLGAFASHLIARQGR
jgi:glycyl-tRNA synthetase beta chain